jgi:uncharacterized protein YlxW (UPF0749 family)
MVSDEEEGQTSEPRRQPRAARHPGFRRAAVVGGVLLLAAGTAVALNGSRTASGRIDRIDRQAARRDSMASDASASDATLTSALTALAGRVSALESEVSGGQTGSDQIATDLGDLQTRVSSLERAVGNPVVTGYPLPIGLQDTVSQLQVDVNSLKSEVDSLRSCVASLSNGSTSFYCH